MIVLHVISSLAPADGHAKFCRSLAERLAAQGSPQKIFTLPARDGALDPDPEGIVHYARGPAMQVLNVRLRFGLEKQLATVACKLRPDVIHLHGGWHPLLFAGARVARRMRIPIVLSLHGSLRPRVTEDDRRLKKRLAWWLYQRRLVERTDVIHGSTDWEKADVDRLGFQKPVVIVPNGVNAAWMTNPVDMQAFHQRWPECRGKRVLLFLSRLHPGKGLDLLVAAWSRVAAKFPGWHLLIAGPDESGTENQIKRAVRNAGLESRVTFCGPLYGTDQATVMTAANLFVLPTYGDSFGMVVLESLACGVPVVTTKGAPWKSLLEERCGWWVDVGVAPLAEALREAMALTDAQRQVMGARGAAMVRDRFSWDRIGKEMASVYDWIVGQGPQPDCVQR